MFANGDPRWQVLGLDGNASEKDIRRAYAMRLKQLDIANEADTFAALRSAYEFALASARSRDTTHRLYQSRAKPSSAPLEAPQPDPVDLEDALPLAASVDELGEGHSLMLARDQVMVAWKMVVDDPSIAAPELDSAFETLEAAFEIALRRARRSDGAPEIAAALRAPEAFFEIVVPNTGAYEAPADQTGPFYTMRLLVEARNYDAAAWQQLLNDPLLDDQKEGERFEYALVHALSENELKTDYTLSAGKDWQDLVESRYGWVSDGLRFAGRFDHCPDLREALIDLRKPPYAPNKSDIKALTQSTDLNWRPLAAIALIPVAILVIAALFSFLAELFAG